MTTDASHDISNNRSTTTSERLARLRRQWREVSDLRACGALLHWDQATYMPEGGAEARGRQLSLLSRLAHEKLIDPSLGELLNSLSDSETDATDSDDAALVRVASRAYNKAVRVPGEYEARLSDHLAATYQAWTIARPANDWATLRPMLEQTLDLSREYASFFPEAAHVADPLIDDSDEGMTVAQIRPLFARLRAELVPLVEAVTSRPPADDAVLRRGYEEKDQVAFSRRLAEAVGYDLARGRLDETHHPFMTKFSLGDVRITNRVDENDLADCLFGTLHEAGHALYEQNIQPDYEATPLGDGTSSGVHESQSRLWENLVGRSRAFWNFWYPQLQREFPAQLEGVSPDEFYRAINRVSRSLIRTESDELTYNLHVMIRFDLEVEMLEGNLSIADLPGAWRERYRSDLGVAPDDDRDGCLQDVHWFGGLIGGAFQGYTLGNILSAQFFDAAKAAHPDIEANIERGDYSLLLNWLRENVYRHGAKYSSDEVVRHATGQAMTIEPYMAYLRGKYGALYGV